MGTPEGSARQIKAIIHRTALLSAVWMVLVRLDPAGLVAGLVVVPLAVWASLRTIPAQSPLRLWRLPVHVPRFVAGSVAGGIDVARRAFSPAMPLDPAWLRVPVNLSAGARAALGAELSLMPGTLAAGADGDHLLVHVLARDSDPARQVAGLEGEIAALIDPGPAA